MPIRKDCNVLIDTLTLDFFTNHETVVEFNPLNDIVLNSSASRPVFKNSLVRFHLAVLPFLGSLLLAGSAWAYNREPVFIGPPPDPCFAATAQFNQDPWPSETITVLGEFVDLYPAGPESDGPLIKFPTRPLALIIDGNGFNDSDYINLASYLADSAFNVVVVDRPANNGPNPVDLVFGALEAAFDAFELPTDTPVALIGHSYGGMVAINTILENVAFKTSYAIDSLVLLAPKVTNGTDTLLTGDDTLAVLAVYGSQDNDVNGIDENLIDAFAAYDRLGSEANTLCPGSTCTSPQMHKTMVYIHGADHAGLIGETPKCTITPMGISSCDPHTTYIYKGDQFCITKAYTRAMLEWTLDGDNSWKSMLMGNYVPLSIYNIVSSAADELGNPGGTPLRMALQVSPAERREIENFEDATWSILHQTANVSFQLATEGQYAGSAYNIRHTTKLGLLGWPTHDTWQYIAFNVPALSQDATAFTHLSVRFGQLAGVNDSEIANPPNSFAKVLIGLRDEIEPHSPDWEWSHNHVDIPPADLKPDNNSQSVMNTVKIPLTAFNKVDQTQISAVYFAFPAGSQGTLLIDSIEWTRE